MLKKDITYEDLDGNKITETFWFHLSKAELAEMAMAKEGKQGGFETWVRTLMGTQDGQTIVDAWKKILLSTIGQRSEDNKRFIKNEEIRQDFLNSDAYSELFMELITDSDKMAAFVNGVVPANMSEQVGKALKESPDLATFQQQGSTPAVEGPMARIEEKRVSDVPPPKDERPDWLKQGRVPTAQELKGASDEEIQEAFRLRAQNAGPVTQEQIPPQ
jgi:hypothetical protein